MNSQKFNHNSRHYHHKGILLASCLLIAASSCKKDGGPGTGNTASLLGNGTGWEKVSDVAYQQSALGIEGGNGMTPYDLSAVGGGIALVYSEDSRLQGITSNNYFKAVYSPGTGFSKPVASGFTKVVASSEMTQCIRFVPGAYNAFNTVFTMPGYWDCNIYHEGNTHPAGQTLGTLNQVFNTRWAADGSVYMGQAIPNANASTSWIYKYPASGNFKVVVNQWSGDSTKWVHAAPVQLSDGTFCDFVASEKGDDKYFSIVRHDDQLTAPSPAPNCTILTRTRISGLLPPGGAGIPLIVGTASAQDQFTVLLGNYGRDAANNLTVTGLSCYRWTKASNTFEKLYSSTNINPEVFRSLTVPNPAGDLPGPLGPYRANPVQFMPDGTAFMLFEYVNPANDNDRYTAVYTLNAKGEKIIGKYSKKDFPNNFYYQYGISACRYIDGAFYAMVHPKNEEVSSAGSPDFRMELIKLSY